MDQGEKWTEAVTPGKPLLRTRTQLEWGAAMGRKTEKGQGPPAGRKTRSASHTEWKRDRGGRAEVEMGKTAGKAMAAAETSGR